MARKKNDDPNLPDPQEMTFEQALAELDSINQRIEQGTVSLEESLAAYRRGVALAKRCSAILDTAEQELKKVKPGESDDEVKK
jgi:exodeoxyribonuclease VII small subunit